MDIAPAELVSVPAQQPCVVVQKCFPPINFIYGHFHNSIRADLSFLADRVRSLEVPTEGVELMLRDLRERYKFLEQVYKYHSTVEDEV
jgi:zinc finger-like protein